MSKVSIAVFFLYCRSVYGDVMNFSVQPQSEVAFSGRKSQKPLKYQKDTLLNNNLKTKFEMGSDKLVKAFTKYPAKV